MKRNKRHFTIISGGSCGKQLENQEIAIPINAVKYFVLNYKDKE